MRINRNTILIAIACVIVGYVLASAPPAPAPAPNRPVARWFARAARNLIWFAAFADPPPAESQGLPECEMHAASFHAGHDEIVGADGYPIIDHARGL